MGIALMFLLALYQMQSAIHSEIIETPSYGGNSLLETDGDNGLSTPQVPQDNDLMNAVLSSDQPEKAELEFRHPISVIGIDYTKNAVLLRFRKPRYKFDPELEAKRRSLADNFMHFGKRQAEQLPPEGTYDASDEHDSMEKRSSMDRYGRDPKQDFMRFGRDPKQDFMRFGRDPKQDFMRFGRDPKQDFMRFGRDPKQDFMRFGRNPSDFMRFGRDPKQDFMRFGRFPAEDFMRFGRPDNFIRFGRNPHEELRSVKQDFMRFGRPDNFMRFGRSAPPQMDSNFIRFGKSVKAPVPESKGTKSGQPGESNSVDKAVTELFKKQDQQVKSGEQTSTSTDEGSTEQDQFFSQ
ncbi:hypothetical protein KR200_008954 [Drosophila serrata]|nr:hypothetical protein KR200_008954 [Drosophila serrata]